MGEPTIRQLRAWQRRADTLERNAMALMSEMIGVVGVEHEAAGENMTSQADEVVATAKNLLDYLETCVGIAKRRRAKNRRAEPADPAQQGGEHG